jgi:hypothetical protein
MISQDLLPGPHFESDVPPQDLEQKVSRL